MKINSRQHHRNYHIALLLLGIYATVLTLEAFHHHQPYRCYLGLEYGSTKQISMERSDCKICDYVINHQTHQLHTSTVFYTLFLNFSRVDYLNRTPQTVCTLICDYANKGPPAIYRIQ